MHFYPRPPRGGRPAPCGAYCRPQSISIHALREEGDKGADRLQGPADPISIHALREEGDSACLPSKSRQPEFLSTPSARRATCGSGISAPTPDNFYPRPPRGGRRGMPDNYKGPAQFLSTPSARRATCRFRPGRRASSNFYPRPPRGGRRHASNRQPDALQFLSTPSARRATYWTITGLPWLQISIHALREEGDLDRGLVHFLRHGISIHALREEGDALSAGRSIRPSLFLSTPSARRAT